MTDDLHVEWMKCDRSVPYFVRAYVSIYDATGQELVKFDLWPAQVTTLETMVSARKLVVLTTEAVWLYNQERPHLALDYRTPASVHGGL